MVLRNIAPPCGSSLTGCDSHHSLTMWKSSSTWWQQRWRPTWQTPRPGRGRRARRRWTAPARWSPSWCGPVARDATGAYVAGSLFALHAARHDPWQETARLALPFLERLRDATGETSHLGVPRGARVEHVAQVDSTYLLATRDWTQLEVPEHCSSLGKVLYAFGRLPMPDGPLLERPTDHSVGDLIALDRDLAEVRHRGYAVTIDELEVGLTAVAAPVRGLDGEVVAAIGVSGPTARLADRVDQVGRLL